MPNDTITVFDTTQAPRVDAALRLYHPVISLPDGELVALRRAVPPDRGARHGRHVGSGQPRAALAACIAEASSWPETIALWLALPSRELGNPDFPINLRMMLRHGGLAADRMSLELPEADAMRVTHDGLLLLSALRDAGIGLILAEFGGAIASLSILKRLPLTAMALSPALVAGFPTDHEDASLMRAAIAMAHTLGLAVIADGIASNAQNRWLAGLGCVAGLGPVFGPPRAAGQVDLHRRHT